jgi:hypothetical protein
MAQAHVWHEDVTDEDWMEGHGESGFFWDDAEDHGGFDRNTPCGPFEKREQAVQDATKCFGQEPTIIEGKPERYEDHFDHK